jgi:hypothetical protein
MSNFDTCPICRRKFTLPEYLGSIVAIAYINGKYVETCPLCYAKNVEKIHNIKWNPNFDSIAGQMFEEAKRQYPL